MTAPETLPVPPKTLGAAAVHKSRRKWPWVIGGVVALFFIIGIANIGNSSTPATANTGNASTPATATATPAVPIPVQQGAAGPLRATAHKAEATFLADLQTAGVPLTSQSTLTGYAACVILKSGTSQDRAAAQIATPSHLTSQQASYFVTAAGRDLCSIVK
jgi:hypothetical protein